MKILQINKFYHLQGGSERYLFELAEILKKNGHTVIPFSMRDPKNLVSPYDRYFTDPVELNKFSLKNILKIFHNWNATLQLERLIKKERPDIAHLHNIAYQITPAVIKVLKKHCIPVVQTLHDYKLICPNYQLYANGQNCWHCRGGKYYRCAVQKCVKNSYGKSFLAALEAYWNEKKYQQIDLFIAPSQFMQKTCSTFGIPEDKIRHLVYPIDIEKFKKPETNIEGSPKYLLYFGRLSPEKGLDILIQAMKLVDNSLSLKIVGEGPAKETLKRMVEKNKLEGRVKFCGRQGGEALLKLVGGAYAIVIPSLWPENMPLSLLEAMAMEKAVIVSKTGGMPERIEDGQNGFIFLNGDVKNLAGKINYLKRFNLEKIGEEARKSILDFRPERHYAQIMNIYQEMVDKNNQQC